jgi:hypothetical protein
MRSITNPDEFRANVRIRLQKFISDENMCKNLEKGIYNYCIKEATERQIVKKWDNVYFTHLYIDRLRTLYNNLKRLMIILILMTTRLVIQKSQNEIPKTQ